MTSQKCMQLAEDIVNEKADWFIDGAGTTLEPEEYDVGLPSEMAYYKIGLPVSANDGAVQGSKIVTGVAGDCKFVCLSFHRLCYMLQVTSYL